MSILLLFDVDARRELAAGSLSPLVQALRADLQPMLAGRLPVPEQKARLTRVGGRCSFDGTLLAFDPWMPHEHKCPQCHRVFISGSHDDWWAMGAQLWIAERAAQAAALQLTTGEKALGSLAHRMLSELADRYDTYPNSDNALGPTRPFFSTYLESIWLINLCHAIALLEQQGDADIAMLDKVRRQLVRPSRDLIASFHEGKSNRQVWNEVAVLSASRVLNDDVHFQARLNRKHGLFSLFATGLLDDGTWYEGENYHLFAHRGLWYAVELLRAANVPLPNSLEARYRAGFVTPFLGVLPDDTIPSRRDSQYKVSIRQWRFAEWCEMGIAHAHRQHIQPDERLTGTLHRLYHPDGAIGLQTERRHAVSTADSERNEPAALLSRADLSWRSLLMARPALPDAASWSPGSVCLPRQGLAVIRRDAGHTYVALEGGHTGGGHGHPDRLALTVQRGHDRWLEDPGTGSYVEQKLHWYRSTLAHAAPIVNGASQDGVPAQLLAFEDRGGAGWTCKRVENVKPGVNMQRTIVVCDGYAIDLLEWDADRIVQIDLRTPTGFDFPELRAWRPAEPGGAGGLEDGFDFLTDVAVDARVTTVPGDAESDCNSLSASRNQHAGLHEVVHYAANTRLTAWRGSAPGSPGQDRSLLHWLRMSGRNGYLASIWFWKAWQSFSTSGGADGFADVSVTMDGTESIHTRTESGWHIALKARHATSSIDLAYLPLPQVIDVREEVATRSASLQHPAPVLIGSQGASRTIQFKLGEQHYLQTEQSWVEAGSPGAIVELELQPAHDTLTIRVVARTGEIVVPAIEDENMLDNERRDVNADGVELFLASTTVGPWKASWILVPANDAEAVGAHLPARTTATTPGTPDLDATWSSFRDNNARGYVMHISVPISTIPLTADGSFVMEIIVNERPRDRARRRGQLVLSGGRGFSYLRGDRAETGGAITFRVAAAEHS